MYSPLFEEYFLKISTFENQILKNVFVFQAKWGGANDQNKNIPHFTMTH